MTVIELRREIARLVEVLRRLLPGDQFASDIERLVECETAEAAARAPDKRACDR